MANENEADKKIIEAVHYAFIFLTAASTAAILYERTYKCEVNEATSSVAGFGLALTAVIALVKSVSSAFSGLTGVGLRKAQLEESISKLEDLKQAQDEGNPERVEEIRAELKEVVYENADILKDAADDVVKAIQGLVEVLKNEVEKNPEVKPQQP